jgi:catechol 2,3-dioxygenase-like lactoylglutathione lyase family enzyme
VAEGRPLLRVADCYHTGVVVPDLDAGMDRMTRLAGHRFMTPLEVETPMWQAGVGATVVELRFAYSLEAPHLELIQAVPGTTWSVVPGRALHHLGYWVDDLSATCRALEEQGLALEMCGGDDPATPTRFGYHLGPDGLRIEVVDRAVIPDWPAFLAAFTPPPA